MPEHMRCCAAKINPLADPLPHSLEGGLRDGFAAISDDKPIDLASRLEERCKLLIKRNQPVSGFALCLADDWPIVLVYDSALHRNQTLLPVNVLPSQRNHLASPHSCKDQERQKKSILLLQTGDSTDDSFQFEILQSPALFFPVR